MTQEQPITSLSQIPKSQYETIIWDIRNQTTKSVFGGKDTCPHPDIDKTNRCNICGAYYGYLKDMQQSEFEQQILIELATSTAIHNTILISPRPIYDNITIKSLPIPTPNYKSYIWLNKYGSNFDKTPQKATYIIVFSKTNSFVLAESKYIVNKQGYDPRLLDLGKTLIITRDSRWFQSNPNITYKDS